MADDKTAAERAAKLRAMGANSIVVFTQGDVEGDPRARHVLAWKSILGDWDVIDTKGGHHIGVDDPLAMAVDYLGVVDVMTRMIREDAIAAWQDEQARPVLASDQPKRLDPAFRATLIEFATERIQAVWNDVGETDAATLAQNIVAAQEFAWMSLHVPVPADQVRAETLEAAADALSEHHMVPGGIVGQVQAAYDMGAKVRDAHGAVPWLRARAAEYRKAAGA